jgi:hypothetical protein
VVRREPPQAISQHGQVEARGKPSDDHRALGPRTRCSRSCHAAHRRRRTRKRNQRQLGTRSANCIVTGGDRAWSDRRGGVRSAACWGVSSAMMARAWWRPENARRRRTRYEAVSDAVVPTRPSGCMTLQIGWLHEGANWHLRVPPRCAGCAGFLAQPILAGMAEWRNGGMAECRNAGMPEWRNALCCGALRRSGGGV